MASNSYALNGCSDFSRDKIACEVDHSYMLSVVNVFIIVEGMSKACLEEVRKLKGFGGVCDGFRLAQESIRKLTNQYFEDRYLNTLSDEEAETLSGRLGSIASDKQEMYKILGVTESE